MKKIKNFLFVKAQKAFKRGTGVVLCSVLMLFASCVKQKNCDCGETGKFIYLKEPYTTLHAGLMSCKSATITAHFISDNREMFYISGDIPKRFQVQDSIQVNICMKNTCPAVHLTTDVQTQIYSLKCIERE